MLIQLTMELHYADCCLCRSRTCLQTSQKSSSRKQLKGSLKAATEGSKCTFAMNKVTPPGRMAAEPKVKWGELRKEGLANPMVDTGGFQLTWRGSKVFWPLPLLLQGDL